MADVLRVALTLVLVLVTAFCGVGFFATYEPPGFPVFRWLYGTVAAACGVAVVAVWLARSSRRRP